ncbi:MAG: fused MFS/spermidine synthase [Bryobacteraceae bacterium]
MLVYGITIFLSAFLLFQVQPLIAKTILAWFGGTAAVWTTCMLFFQLLLLAGYFYSHLVVRKLAPRTQAIVHTSLLGLAVLLLPIIPSASWKPTGLENPTLRILLLLGATVGLPYLLCSTTGPLVQAWYARREKSAAPYRLFALSNLGSMLALVTYPVFVEPRLATRSQAWTWSAGFVLFAIVCAATAWRSAGSAGIEPRETEESEAEGDAPGLSAKLLWIALAACPSLLMLAVTNHLTQDVAAIPFLWVAPLSIYLLSFILTFDARGWYRRNLFLVLLAPALGGMAYLQWSEAPKVPTMPQTVGLLCLCFFVCCMVCHGELAGRKPAPRHLTSFYLMLSIGGALGGLFVGVVAPYLFSSYWELPAGIGLCGLLAWVVAVNDTDEDAPSLGSGPKYFSVASICLALGVLGLWVFLGRTMRDMVRGYLLVERNFYGTLRVRENDSGKWEGYRTLLHGSINHGEQWTHPQRRRELLTYYCGGSGIGRAIRSLPASQPRKIGVLGLGAGTMAAFSRPGDEIKFYEINPLVPQLSSGTFTFFPDTQAKKQIVMGDGRLSLEREQPNNFDVLMMDAFSGDSIPVHLCTREAFDLYFRHIKPDGVIAMHISNKYLDLEPVLARISESIGKPALLVESEEDESGNCFGTTFILFANDESVFRRAEFEGGHKPTVQAAVGLWTDDYSNLFTILK